VLESGAAVPLIVRRATIFWGIFKIMCDELVKSCELVDASEDVGLYMSNKTPI